ncbi:MULTISPECIES: PilZ domain-containing protein [unclassified Sphingomonas]|uniref:PilZ domain-containing protein n=1 Tax=unclassified Sphingomonas TaxID=196159 RepID=UPI00226A35CA|nr:MULTISPECIES: PilZ domain-containing protein [unclassified Sphingomonas]
MFAAEFQPVQDQGRRRSARAPVALEAKVGGDGLERTLCKVIDVSIHGARIQTYSALKRGAMIWLTLPLIGAVAADVMWADDFNAGCQFRAPLDLAAFETLTERHPVS